MEFLIEYGLFFAKTLTFLIALIVVIGVIASAAMKGKKSDDDIIEIEKINDQYENYKLLVNEAVCDPESLKKSEKERKKKAKEEKKRMKHKDGEEQKRGRAFVVNFDGDVKASDAENLRKMMTAILTEATPDDEVIVKLESAGGMVHSYGLASSQLARIRSKNIPLTVCVDKVAASGGYMMACVADKILAAPFAIIGSIGVVAQLPNFNKLLKKTNIDYEMFTAGEYKRTLTMFGENTDKGREKFVEDLEDTHQLFKQFVIEYRDIVDIAEVATGEIWFGRRALDRKLIDEIQTSDEYLFELSKEKDIYELSISPKKNLIEKLGVSISTGIENAVVKLFQMAAHRYYS